MAARLLAVALVLLVAVGCSSADPAASTADPAASTADPAAGPVPPADPAAEPDADTPAGPNTGAEPDTEDRVLLDVRTPDEFAEGHLIGAANHDVQDPAFAEEIGALPRDGRYLVYCRSGNRSAQAVAIMADLGFEDVVDGGAFSDLVAAGLPAS